MALYFCLHYLGAFFLASLLFAGVIGVPAPPKPKIQMPYAVLEVDGPDMTYVQELMLKTPWAKDDLSSPNGKFLLYPPSIPNTVEWLKMQKQYHPSKVVLYNSQKEREAADLWTVRRPGTLTVDMILNYHLPYSTPQQPNINTPSGVVRKWKHEDSAQVFSAAIALYAGKMAWAFTASPGKGSANIFRSSIFAKL